MAARTTARRMEAGGILETQFKLRDNATTVGTEVIGGLTTFFVMAYIIFLNPQILNFDSIPDLKKANLGPGFEATVAMTALTAGLLTIAMGLWANRPFALAAGLGLNAVVAFQLILGSKLPWQAAMGIIFMEGVVITILVLTGLREMVLNAIPLTLKRAIGVGIGLFILLIGLVNAGVVIKGGGFITLSQLNTGPVFTIMLSDFFDTMGTVVGIGGQAGWLDAKGRLPGISRVLLVDSVGAAFGGLMSASSNTTYIESAAGVSSGARTGLASVVTGVLFLLAMFISPIVGVVPSEATAPALVLVGFLMAGIASRIDFGELEEGLPALLTVVVMPFTYSITNGVGAGFVTYAFLKLVRGKAREVHWLMWVVVAAFILYFAQSVYAPLLGGYFRESARGLVV